MNLPPYPYRCWKPEDHGHEEAEASTVPGLGPDSAAEEYAERHYADDDYPTSQTVHVRSPDGDEHIYEVVAEETVVFRSRLVATIPLTQTSLPGAGPES